MQILLLETIEASAHKLLASRTEITLADNPAAGLAIAVPERFSAIITRGKGQVDRALLKAFPNLKVVARCGVGLDNIDVEAATALGIKVFNTPGVNTHTVAEHAMSLMLMLVRNLEPTIRAVKAGNWEVRNGLQTDEIRGKRLAILGMGNIGKRLAQMAEVFGMEIVYWDLQKQDVPYEAVSLERALKESDVLSLHLPLTDKTRQLISAKALKMMKPQAVLINTARGQLIDQQALAEALYADRLGGFGADVLAVEPPPASEILLAHPRVLLTPHSASLTGTTYREMCRQTVENVLALLHDQPFDEKAWFNRAALI